MALNGCEDGYAVPTSNDARYAVTVDRYGVMLETFPAFFIHFLVILECRRQKKIKLTRAIPIDRRRLFRRRRRPGRRRLLARAWLHRSARTLAEIPSTA